MEYARIHCIMEHPYTEYIVFWNTLAYTVLCNTPIQSTLHYGIHLNTQSYGTRCRVYYIMVLLSRLHCVTEHPCKCMLLLNAPV